MVAVLAGPAASARWSAPRTVVPPQRRDVGPLVLAGDPAGSALLGLTAGDGDIVGDSAASLFTGRLAGRYAGGRRIAGAEAVLDAAYLSGHPVLLLGGAPAQLGCCSTVAALAPGRGLRTGRPFVTGLTGAVHARLVPDGRRLLAVVASDRGVWVALSSADGRRFGAPRRLGPPSESPQSLAVAPEARGGAAVAWTARTGGLTAPGPTAIRVARAGAGRLPGTSRVVVRTASDHAVDDVALGPGPVPQLVWVESDVDRAGRFRSVVRAGAVGSGRVTGRVISPVRRQAGALAVAGRPGAPVIAVWSACDLGGTCSAEAAVAAMPGGRHAARGRPGPPARFAAPRTLGSIDSLEAPVAGLSDAGVPYAAWIGAGAVRAVAAPSGRFGRPWILTRSAYASGVTLAAAGRAGMLAAWVEGTARERVRVADWRR